MAIKYLFLLMIVFPYFLLAQQASPVESAGMSAKPIECRDKIFKQVEQLPGFKISREAFQDSLLVYLKSKNATLPQQKYAFIFVLTAGSQVSELTSLQGSKGDEQVLYQAILDNAHLFIPAKQNGHPVCMYAKLGLDFKNKKIRARFFQ
jgi:hypothetical protein